MSSSVVQFAASQKNNSDDGNERLDSDQHHHPMAHNVSLHSENFLQAAISLKDHVSYYQLRFGEKFVAYMDLVLILH